MSFTMGKRRWTICCGRRGGRRLILVDLDPPKVGGLEVIRAIKQRPDTSTIPVVALTSSSEPRDVAESYRAGVNSYIRKQTGFEEFRKSIRALVLYWTRYNHTAR